MNTRDPRIERYERDEDGHWIYLKAGFCDAENPTCHTIVESSRFLAFAHTIEQCNCKDCLKRTDQ